MPADVLEITDRTGLDFSDRRRAVAALPRRRTQRHGRRSSAKGQLVRHPQFGIGRISEVTDMGQHTRAIVDFNQAGRKTLILQYARLEPVG